MRFRVSCTHLLGQSFNFFQLPLTSLSHFLASLIKSCSQRTFQHCPHRGLRKTQLAFILIQAKLRKEKKCKKEKGREVVGHNFGQWSLPGNGKFIWQHLAAAKWSRLGRIEHRAVEWSCQQSMGPVTRQFELEIADWQSSTQHSVWEVRPRTHTHLLNRSIATN